MSDQWYEQQHKQRQGQGGGTGARREALAGVGPERGAPDNNDQGGEGGEGGAVSNQDGEWVEGSGWRMKAPEEKKRQQVMRGRQHAERVDRERQEWRANIGRAYTTPGHGGAVLRNGVRAAPLGEDALRIARARSAIARKFERKQAREERESLAKAEEDAIIQKKLDRARRAQEKLQDKQKREIAKLQKEVHSSWEQRSLGTNHGDPSGIDVIPTGGYYPPEHNPDGDLEHTDILESKQIAAAVRNSLADSGSSGGGVGEFPPPPVPSRELRTHGMETPRRSEARRVSSDDRGAPRRETATNLWHPIPAGVTGSSDADGGVAETTGDDWDADLAEALSVVDWDVSDEISSEEDREGFRRNMLRLVRGVLGGDERHRKVRSDNATFHANIGRWACGRKLMRLAGFVMQREESAYYLDDTTVDAGGLVGRHAGYVWVSRPHRPSGHVNMLQDLVGALEEQQMRSTTPSTTRGSSGAGAPPSSPSQEPAQQARTSYTLASGFYLSPPSRLVPAIDTRDERSRTLQEQDLEFEEALRQDRASLAAKRVKTPSVDEETGTKQGEEQTPPPNNVGPHLQDTGGRSLKDDTGTEHGDDSSASPTAWESPEEKSAKIAQSYAHLGLGS